MWAHSGRELFFAEPVTREFKAVAFTTTSTTFQPARPTTLFTITSGMNFNGTTTGNDEFYDVALDDQRFLMARWQGVDDSATSFILVQNFFEELKVRVPVP